MKPKFFLAKSIATLLAGLSLATDLHALPQGAQVQAGTATFSQAGGALNIQTSDRAIINYQSFSIGGAERVNFVQPSNLSITLNRVTAPNPSQILGTLTSNGKIVLANPYGIYFGPNAVVNVGGLVAGAGRISDSDFLAGKMNFSSLSAGVENRGSIVAVDDVALYGTHVSNTGSITSQNGSVTLAAGSSVYVGEAGGNIFVGAAPVAPAAIPRARVVSRPGLANHTANTGSAPRPAVKNSGSISAPKASLVAGDMYGIAIAQSGSIVSGDITIAGGKGGAVNVSGTLNASNLAPGRTGGKINIKGDTIAVTNATLNANGAAGGGAILLDAGHNSATPTTVTSGGTITAVGTGIGAKGGSVEMLGDQVGLLSSAVVDVSGAAGGGTALIGGDLHGANPNVQNAERTYISLGAQIHADALVSGDGGKVVVWADDWTKFYGSVSARGGATSGNGGFAEVSGKITLGFYGSADLSASRGVTGTLLLDPKILSIVDALGALDLTLTTQTGTINFADTNLTDTLSVTAINTLGIANNIVLNAGEIDFNNTLSIALGLNKSISFTTNKTTATGGNDSITNTGGNAFSITTSGTGTISFTTQVSGAVDLTGITLATAATGGVAINAQGSVTAGTVNAAGATVAVHAATGNVQGGVITSANLSAVADTGDVVLNAATNVISGNVALSSPTGNISFANGGTFTVGTVGTVNGVQAPTAGKIVSLQSTTGGIAQDLAATSKIAADTLSLQAAAGSSITLANTANSVNALGLNVSLGGGSFTLVDSPAFTLTKTIAATGGITLTSGGLLTLNQTVNAGAGSVSLTGAGITNTTTVTGQGGITANAGTGVLDNTAGTLTNGGTANAITLTADKMALTGGTITAGSAPVSLASATLSDAINLGSLVDTTASTLELSGVELNTVTTTGMLTIGSAATTGAITVSAAVNLTGATGGLTLLNNTGGIAVSAGVTSPAALVLTANGGGASVGAITGSGVIGATSLTATAATGIALSGPSTVQAVTLTNTTSGNISYTGSSVGAANTLTVGGSNTGTLAGGSFTVVETTGALTVAAGGITTKGGAVSLTTQKAGGLLTLTGNADTTVGSAAGASVVLRGDALVLTGTVNAGTAGSVQLRPNNLAAVIGVEDATQTFNVTNAMLGQITASGSTVTVGDMTHTGNISAAGNNAISLAAANANALALVTDGSIKFSAAVATVNGITANGLSLSAGANGNNAGAITQDHTKNTGTLSTTGGNLSLAARGGIGVIASADPILIGSVTGGSLLATNANSGDLFLKTGTISLGGAGISQNASAGVLRVDATAAAGNNITITGNLSAGTANNGTITLNATGTILDGTPGLPASGTLSAATVNLGTVSATAVGAAGDPISTATANLNAVSSAGAVVVTNSFAGATSLSAQATGGLVNIANTNALGTLGTAAAITSSNSSVTLSSVGNMTIANNVTAGGTGAVSLSVTGLNNQLSHTGGVISTNNGAINLTADNMALTAGANMIQAGLGGGIAVTAATAANTIDLGSAGGPTAGKLELSAAELLEFQTTGVLTIGDAAHTGQISVTAAVATTNATGGVTLLNKTGGIAVNNVLTSGAGAAAINLTADGGSGAPGAIGENASGGLVGGLLTTLSNGGAVLTSANNQVTSFNATNAGTGNVSLANTAAPLTITGISQNTGDVIINNTGGLATSTAAITTAANGNITLNTSVNETIGANVTAGGAGGVTLQSTGTGSVTVNTGVTVSSTSGAILVRADSVVLNGTAAISTGAGGVQLRPQTLGNTIGVEDNTQAFNVTNVMLGQITTSGVITIGDATHTGNISVARQNAINQGGENITLINQGANTANIVIAGNNDFTAKNLTLSAGGAITQPSGTGALITQNTGNLVLNATQGIGSLAGPAPIVIGAVAGNLSAVNGPNVGGSGNVVLSTGPITLGVAGAVIDEQIAGGTISVTSSGAITIGGNVSVSGLGASSIILNATGAITRTAGTITAQNVSLTGTGIGTNPAPILTAATGTLTLSAGAGGAFVNNTGSVTLAAPTLAANAPITVTSTGTLTLPAVAFSTGTGNIDFESNGGTLATAGTLTTTSGNITLAASDGVTGVTLGHDLTTGGGNIQINGLTTLSGGRALTSAGGNITFNGAIAGAGNTLTLDAGATGAINGTSADNVSTLTITNSGGTTFSGAIGATAPGAVILSATTGTIAFQGNTHITTLTTTANPYSVSFTGTTNIVDNAVNFTNTGNLTLGNGGDAITFTLGVNTTVVGGTVTVAGTVNTTNTALTLGAVTLGADSALNAGSGTLGTGAITGAGNSLTILGSGANTVASATGINVLALNQTAGSVTFTGNVSATGVTTLANGFDIVFDGAANAITNAVSFTNTGALTLGNGGDLFTFAGGLDTTAVGGTVTVAGTVNTTNTLLKTGAITLGSNTVLSSNATTGAGDITITGAVSGGGFDLTLQTGAVAGADVNGTSVSGVGTLQLQNIGGTASFSGAVSVTSFNVPATVVNVSSTGTGGTIANLFAPLNTGNLTLGQAGGTQAYTGGLDTSGVGGVVTLNGGINTTNTLLKTGAVTLGSNTTLNSNATSGAGDIAIGAVSGGGFDLTLQTGAVAGADVNGTSVSGVGTLQLQNIGGTASFSGAVSVTSFNVPATVVNVSSTGTGGTIANLFAPLNTGTLTLGQAGGTQAYTGGLDTSGVGGVVTLNGGINTTNTLLKTGAVTLGSNTTLNSNATSGAGDIAIGAVSGGGFDLTLQTGAVAGADVNGTSVSGVGTLQLQNIGGTASFSGAVSVTSFNVPATVVNVSSTGTGGTIANLFAPLNTGTLTLGQAGGTQAYTGGLDTSGVGGVVTLNGGINTTNTLLKTGAVTLGSNTTLNSNATSGAGDIAIGAVSGGGFDLTLQTGAVAGADVNGTSVSGVGTLQLQNIGGTASFSGAVSVTSFNVPATVVNVSSTGTGGTIANLFAPLNTGTLTLGQAGGTQTFLGGMNTTGVVGTVTLNGTILSSGPLTFGALSLGQDTLLTTTNGSLVGAALTIGAVTGNNFTLGLDAGTGGVVTVASGDNINTLTVVNSGGTTVTGDLGQGTAGAVTITNTTGTVAFQGNTNITILTTTANPYNVSLTGAANTIAGATTFNNTGVVTLGDQSTDTVAFTGGVVATAPSLKNIAGTISAAGTGVINLGVSAVRVTDSATVGGTSTGQITLGNATIADGRTLTVGAGAGTPISTGTVDNMTTANSSNLTVNTTGVATIGGAVGATQPLNVVTVMQSGGTVFQAAVNAATIAIADTAAGQTVAFQGNTNASTGMTVGAGTGVYNVSLTGAANTIAGATTFNNTGVVTLGDQSTDTVAFTGGVVATAPSLKNIAGTISAAGTGVINLGVSAVRVTDSATVGGTSTGQITLGNATIADGRTLTVGAGAGTPISTGTVDNMTTANSSNLTVNTTGVATIGGAVGATQPLNVVTVMQSGGTVFQAAVNAATIAIADTAAGQTVAFQGNTNASTGMTVGAGTGAYNVSLTGAANTIAGATTFNNTGVVTLGDQSTDTVAFTGGVVATAPSLKNIAGTISAAGTGVINLGVSAVRVTDSATVGGTSTGQITLGNATIADGRTLTVGAGAGTPISTGTVDNMTTANSSNLTVNTTGVATIGGAVGATQPLNVVTVMQSGGTVFQAAVNAATIAIADTAAGQTVAFQGNTNASTGMTVGAGTGAYNVSLTGAANTIAGATTFNNTGVVTLGDQSTDNITFVAGVTATVPMLQTAGTIMTNGGASATFGSVLKTVTLIAATTVNTGVGAVTFGGTVDGASSLSVLSSGVTTFALPVGGMFPLASISTDAGGTTKLPTSVTTINSQNFADPVTLTADTTLRSTLGGSLNLLSTVSAGGHSLTLSTNGNATLGGTISSLSSLTPSVVGTTTIGTTATSTNITVPTALNFTGPVAIVGNVTIATSTNGTSSAGVNSTTFLPDTTGAALQFSQTVNGPGALTVSAGGTLTFNAAVGSANALGSLSANAPVIVLNNVRTQGDMVINATSVTGGQNATDGLLKLTGASYASLSGSVQFNPVSRANATPHATILSLAGNVAISAAGSFFMGNQQRILVNNGSLTINVGGTATLGDTAASTAMYVTASAVRLQGRALSGFFNQNRKDNGLGIVSPTINFNTASLSFVPGTNAVAVFSTRDSVASVPQIPGVSLAIDPNIANQFNQPNLKLDNLGKPVSPQVLFGMVQPIASGTYVTDPGQVQVIFVLEIPTLVELPEDTFLSKSDQDILARMGIYPREATSDENITVSLRQGVFRQPIEGKAQMDDPEYTVVVNRLTTEEVKAIVQAYTDLAGKDFSNLAKIAAILADQVKKFQDATPGALGLDGFQKWLAGQRATDKSADELAKDLDELSSVFVRLSRIGLTKKEVTICKLKICYELKVNIGNVDVWDIVPLVEGATLPPPRPIVKPLPAELPPADPAAPAPAATPPAADAPAPPKAQ